MSGPLRILLVRLSALGDCLHAVPFVEAVRRQRPDAHVGWLIQAGGRALLQDHPAVDQFHLFDRKAKGLDALRSLGRLRRELRRERYDVAVDLQGLTKSGVLARLAGARRVVGFASPESRELNRWLVKERVAVDAQIEHVVDRNLALLPALGLENPSRATWDLPHVDLSDTRIGEQLTALGLEGDQHSSAAQLAVLNPGTTWPTKIWPQERFAEVARLLHEAGMAVMVSWGGREEEALADRIVRLAEKTGTPITKAASTDLVELRGLFQRAAVVVANDSGPLHLSVAVGVPSVGVFGPTDPGRNGPYGWRDPTWPSRAVTVANLPAGSMVSGGGQGPAEPVGDGSLLGCQYCWKTRCERSDNACLTEVTPQAVVDQVLGLLGNVGAAG